MRRAIILSLALVGLGATAARADHREYVPEVSRMERVQAVYLGYGWKSFALLLAFFVLGSTATRLGYAKKAARGIAERGV